MKRWFYVGKGQLKGPVTVKEIASLIEKKCLGPFDRVSLGPADSLGWVPLNELPEFKEEFRSQQIINPSEWILLVRQKNGKKIQSKPQTTEQVNKQLLSGRVKYSDFAWCSGMAEWYRIGVLHEFIESPESAIKPATGYLGKRKEEVSEELETAEQIYNESVSLQPKDGIFEEQPPMEAVTENLLLPSTEDMISQKSSNEGGEGKDRRAKLRWSGDRRIQKKITAQWTSKWVIIKIKFTEVFGPSWWVPVTLAATLGLSVILVIVISSKNKSKSSVQKIASQQLVNKNALKPVLKTQKPVDLIKNKLTKAKNPSQKLKTVELVKPPSYFKLRFSQLKTPEAHLRFVTDASSHFPIELKWHALPGKVLTKASILKKYVVPKKYQKILKLKFVGLPPGQYFLEAKIDKLTKHARLFVGLNNREFHEDMRRHKKVISYGFLKERKSYFIRVNDLIAWCDKFLNQTEDRSSRAWLNRLKQTQGPESRNISWKTTDRYVFAKRWMDMKNQVEEVFNLLKDARPEELRVVKFRRKIIAFRRKLSKQRADMLSASLY